MQDQHSHKKRRRQLTNRWSVWLADRVAQAVITIGGVSTIVAVLLVFFVLIYVAVPLFYPSSVAHDKVLKLASAPPVVLQGIHDSAVLAWSIDESGKFKQSQLTTGETLSESSLLDAGAVTAAVFLQDTPLGENSNNIEANDFCLGLKDGSLTLGQIQARVVYRQPESLSEEQQALPFDAKVLFENGILEHTRQGMYRWQALSAKVSGTHSLGSLPIVDVDYFRSDSSSALVALDAAGKITLVNVSKTENILTGDVETSFENQELRLPSELTEKPYKVCFLGRGDELAVIWKNGRLIRFNQLNSAKPIAVETVFICPEECEVSSLVLQQGRYTIIVGDNRGQLTAWHLGRDEAIPDAPLQLIKSHTLPPMNGAITALGRSSNLRMIVAGSAAGEVATYHITSERQLTLSSAFSNAVQHVTIAPNDDFILAKNNHEMWVAEFQPQYPEVRWNTMFTPVIYEGYVKSQHKWQSTSGNTESEPKFGIVPLIFGTLKATFYSMLFGAPIALLAAVYTSEFIHPAYKSPIKSTVEMMSMIPSVVLGYLAGMVFAPFVEMVLPAILAGFFVVPFCFLLAAQLWQLLPQKVAIRFAQTRIFFISLTLLFGTVASTLAGPLVERWLFAGNLKEWLGGDAGDGTGGWFLLLLPLSTLLVATVVNNYLNPSLREYCINMSRGQFLMLNLTKFIVASVLTCLIAYLAAIVFTQLSIDSRGGVFDSYIQKNSLVVGFVMGFAIVPIIYTISEDALSTVPQHLRSASLGCGATQWQTTWRVVIPTAASGLFSAIMVGFGRAIGETMIMLMATGNVPIMSTSLFNGFRSLSANIAEELPEAAQWGAHFRLLFLSGVILMIFTFVVNTSAEMVRISFRRKAKQL